MTTPLNQFYSYPLEPEDELEGAKLTHLQRQCLHNARTEVANELLTLVYNPAEPLEFVRKQGYAQGTLAAYTYLLELDTAAQQATPTN